MNGVIKFVLDVDGMPATTIADLEKALPGFAALAADMKAAAPILQKMQPLLEALEPLVEQAWPIWQRALPKITAVLPTTQELIAFVADKPQVA